VINPKSEIENPKSEEGVAEMAGRKIRVLVAKPGLDGHDRGAKVIARALRDAGMEVIYTGLRQTPEKIASAVVQEDVDALLMSILSGAHDYLFPRVMELLKEKGVKDILVLGGGVIPEEDIPALKAVGVKDVFGPGTSTENIVKYVQENVKI
jgi:methylmalonyl-CoA mutase C-terminal domain/subunit